MRLRIITLAIVLLACVYTARAQTTVTGTIHDAQGNPYANGTASAFLAVVSGQTQPPPVNVITTAGGFFTMTLSAGSYAFTLCAPPVARPPIAPTNNPTPTQICFSSAPIAISGGSQDVSANLNPIAASLGVQGTSAGGVTNPSSLNGIIFVDGVTNKTLDVAVGKCPNPGEVDITIATTLSVNTTIPSTCTLRVVQGGITTIANAVTLTLNGPFLAGPYQAFIYTGTGAAVFGPSSVTEATPLNTQWFPGSDWGAQLNNAYASAPTLNSACVTITSPPGTYNFSTPIVLNTSGKLFCLQMYGVTANYTPTTATTSLTADSVNTASFPYIAAHGIYGLNLTNNGCTTNGGCGSSATGLGFGNTNSGMHNGTLQDNKISGFGTAINLTSASGNSWGMQARNMTLAFNTTGLSCPTALENFNYIGGRIIVNGTGISITANCQIFTANISLDSNTTAGVNITSGFYQDVGSHFENFTPGGGVTTHYITSSGGNWMLFGTNVGDDQATGNTDYWFQCNGSCQTWALAINSQGRTATGVFQTTNTAGRAVYEGFNSSPSVLTALYSGASTAVSKLFVNAVGGTAPEHIFENNVTAAAGWVKGHTYIPSFNGNGLIFDTPPTINTHFNTSGDSISSNNGPSSFTVTVGTGVGTSTGSVNLSSATNGWNCVATNQNRAALVLQTANTTASATFTNFGTTFAATNWTNSDVLLITCFAR